jgi:hypothetical protein
LFRCNPGRWSNCKKKKKQNEEKAAKRFNRNMQDANLPQMRKERHSEESYEPSPAAPPLSEPPPPLTPWVPRKEPLFSDGCEGCYELAGFLFFVGAGLILMVGGISLYFASRNDTRHARVVQWEAALRGYPRVFEALAAMVVTVANSSMTFAPRKDYEGGMQDWRGDFTRFYTQGRFKGNASMIDGPSPVDIPLPEAILWKEWVIRGTVVPSSSAPSGGAPAVPFSVAVPLGDFRNVVISDDNCVPACQGNESPCNRETGACSCDTAQHDNCMREKCAKMGGTSVDPKNCRMPHVVSQICLKVDASGAISNRFGGPGCLWDQGHFGPASFKMALKSSFAVKVLPDSIPIYVLREEDPLILQQYLNSGENDFGNTPKEKRIIATIPFCLGVVLLSGSFITLFRKRLKSRCCGPRRSAQFAASV